jgi:D-alanyl-D-alanine carboxypeptidase
MSSLRPSFKGLLEAARIAIGVTALASVAACTAYAGSDPSDGSGSTNGGSQTQQPGSGGTPTAGGASSSSSDPTGTTGSTSNDPTVSAACVQRAVDLKDALDNATDFDAVLAVSTPDCGKQVIVSSDNKSITTSSLHRIGSITKTYVSAVILSLVKDGRLHLTDTTDSFGVWASGPGTDTNSQPKVTVRQLLNHTSGIYNYTDDSSFDPSKTYTPAQLVAIAASNNSYSVPGAEFHYSNTNYILLGMIAEKVTNQHIGQLIRQRVLQPAGLNATFFDGEETISGTLAPGLSSAGSTVTNAESPSSSWAAGAMVATPGDVLDWIDALFSGKFLDTNEMSELLDSGGTSMGDATGITYGLGVMEYPAAIAGTAGPSLGHDGAIRGYRSQASYFTKSKTGMVLIGDATDADVNTAFVTILTLLQK